jgi:hypothetical protein
MEQIKGLNFTVDQSKLECQSDSGGSPNTGRLTKSPEADSYLDHDLGFITEMTHKKDEIEKEIEGYRQELEKYSNTVKML